jgi:hypothetical protein
MKAVVLMVALLAGVQAALAQPARIILLRHAEKPKNDSELHLSEQGKARARALVSLLTTNSVFVTNGLPVALFAPQFTARGHGRRPYETIEPLAAHLKLPVHRPFAAADYRALARQILNNPLFDGKTEVICWVHDYLPALAKELGVKPEPPRWKSSVYDRVWVINKGRGRTELTDQPQNLLPGDSTK